MSIETVLVIGAGSIGMRHAEVLRQSGRRVVIFPKRPERAPELQAQGWSCVCSWEDAAECGAGFAIIASSTGHHVTDTVKALDLGCRRVLVEKPLARSVSDADALCRQSADLRSRIFCGMTLRYSNALRHFRDSLSRVGRIHSASIECRSFLPDWRPSTDYRASYSASAEEGGVLRDLIHEVDYAGWVLGWPAKITAHLLNSGRLGIASEEQAFLWYELNDAVHGEIALDYLTLPPRRQFQVFGSDGVLSWNALKQTVHFESRSGESDEAVFLQDRNDLMLAEHEAFLMGDADRLVRLDEAIHSLAVCDAARASSLSRREELVGFPAVR